jgi:hypothetical protein
MELITVQCVIHVNWCSVFENGWKDIHDDDDDDDGTDRSSIPTDMNPSWLEKLVWKADEKHLEGRRLQSSEEVVMATNAPARIHCKENNLMPTWENWSIFSGIMMKSNDISVE